MGKASRRKSRAERREKLANALSENMAAGDPESPTYRGEQGCYMCSKKHTPEYVKSMEFRQAHNKWDDVELVREILRAPHWSWARNTDCKYLDIRLDTRDGGCIVMAKGRRVSPRQLAWQYSEKTPNPIPDSEAYAEGPIEVVAFNEDKPSYVIEKPEAFRSRRSLKETV